MYLFRFFLFGLIISANISYSQSTCGEAVARLQNYANQVNYTYNNEYWTIIPNNRCPAYDGFGRLVHPTIVQNCRLQMLQSLNQWYYNQCVYVNNTYAQIMSNCGNSDNTANKPAPISKKKSDEMEQIDTDEIEDLTAGVDENKAVRITIPRTAAGFNPN